MNAVYRHPSSRPPSSSSATMPSVRTRLLEDAFVAESMLESWIRSGEVTRAGGLLTTRDGRRFTTVDAVRVIGRRNGETDPYGLTGRVETLRDFMRKGAVLAS